MLNYHHLLLKAEDSSLKNGKHEKNADDDWGDDIDVSDAAIQKRMESLSSAAKSLALTDDVEKTPQQRMDMFYEYVKVGSPPYLTQSGFSMV